MDNPTYKPTSEQDAAITLAQQGNSLKIMAYAGSGKTTTLQLISHALPQKKGLYLAFNKAIATHAAGRFTSNVDCRTFHSLAFRHVSRFITDKLNRPRLSPARFAEEYRLTSQSVRRMLDKRFERFTLTPNRQASLIINGVSNFCATNAQHPAPRHLELPDWLHPEDADGLRALLFPHLERRWQDAIDHAHHAGISHDIYLKLWALSNPIIPADYILFDEAQDSDPIMLGVLLKQTRAQVVYVGDPHQQIYAWRGAVNAMQQLPLEATRLTRSFRFGEKIADIANVFLRELKETTPLEGNPNQISNIDTNLRMKQKNAILCRTNARAMELLLAGLQAGEKVALQADSDRLLRFVDAAAQLKAGRLVHDVPELAWFSSWQDVHEYCETQDGSDIKSLVRLVDDHGVDRLKQALNRITPVAQADYVISTAHKAKGLEWHNVQLENDYSFKLNTPAGNNSETTAVVSDEELRLLYVAATRAQTQLNVHHLAPLITCLVNTQVKRQQAAGVSNSASPLIMPLLPKASLPNMRSTDTAEAEDVATAHVAMRTTPRSASMAAARRTSL